MDEPLEALGAPVEQENGGEQDYLGVGVDEDLDERETILQSLCSDEITLQVAAERLASEVLKADHLGSAFLETWRTIQSEAYRSTNHHQSLVELLATLAKLPPARDDEGNQLKKYDLRVWEDLPMFGWELHDDWRHYANLEDGESESEHQATIATFVNINKFAAQLTRNQHLVSEDYGLWALWLMRDALETPATDAQLESPELVFPAAVAWLSIAGPEIYSWEKDFPPSHKTGDPARGGPFWSGKHGFCKERWNLWKRRFVELSSSSSELSEALKKLAAEGATKMNEAEVLLALSHEHDLPLWR